LKMQSDIKTNFPELFPKTIFRQIKKDWNKKRLKWILLIKKDL
jgi:hypothetical protein